MSFRKPVLVLICISLLVFSLTACSKKQEPIKPKRSVQKQKQTADTDTPGVLMLGRSVMGGWFSHWNAENNTTTRSGFKLYYGEMQTPPDIIESARTLIDERNSDVRIVFFKLCFDDFSGGSYSEARANLNRNKQYVQEAYDIAVKEQGLKLILGNSLPKVKKYSDGDLVWNHREYNTFLNDFASQHPGKVYVFDEYGILADSDGSLKADFATDEEDSHPNDNAYSAMDEPFFKLLQTLK